MGLNKFLKFGMFLWKLQMFFNKAVPSLLDIHDKLFLVSSVPWRCAENCQVLFNENSYQTVMQYDFECSSKT